MKTPITAMRSVPYGWLLVAMTLALTASPALAARDLGGTWYWVPRTDISANACEFRIFEVHRLNGGDLSPPPHNVGDEYVNTVKTGNFYFGDGVNNPSLGHQGLPEDDLPPPPPNSTGLNASLLKSSDIKYRVIDINENENWVLSQVIDKRTNNPPVHTYANTNFTGLGQAPFGSQRCDWFRGDYPYGPSDPHCGKNEPSLVPYDQLNAAKNWRMGGCVWPNPLPEEYGPTGGSPNITNIQTGILKLTFGTNQWQITSENPPASGILRTIRLAYVSSGEAGSGSFKQPQPPLIFITGTPLDNLAPSTSHYRDTGFLQWNTVGTSDGSMWSYNVLVEDWADALNDAGEPAELPLDSLVTYSQLCQELQVCGSADPPVLTATVGGSCGGPGLATVYNVSNAHPAPVVGVTVTTSRVAPGGYISVSHSSPVLTPSVDRIMGSGTVGFNFANPPAAVGSAFAVFFNVVDACGLTTSCAKNFSVANTNPDCSGLSACVPNPYFNDGSFQLVTISGGTDADQDPSTLTYKVNGAVTQDEDAGANCPDAIVLIGTGPNGSDQVYVRVERQQGGNGRVYRIPIQVLDSNGGSCTGTATVCIPVSGTGPCPQNCTDDGVFFPSAPNNCPLSPGDRPSVTGLEQERQQQKPTKVEINRIGQGADGLTLEYALPQDSDVSLNVYDLAGRNLASLASGRREAGVHRAEWNVRGLPKGIYYYRLRAGTVTLSRSVYIP